MEKLNKDELFRLALEFDLPTLLNFCETNKKFNEKVCNKNHIWHYRLDKDFSEHKKLKVDNISPKDKYQLLYSLRDIKDKLKLEETIYNLYDMKNIDLSNMNLSRLPISFSVLINLVVIDLSNNQFIKVPDSLEKLSNLVVIDLSNNNIKILPDWISNLSKLEKLVLSGNKITKIPVSFSKLYNLKILDLSYNSLTKIPIFLSKLQKLKELYLYGNNLKNIPKEMKIHLKIYD